MDIEILREKSKNIPKRTGWSNAGRPPIYTDEVLTGLAHSLLEWTEDLAAKREFGLIGDWCFDNGFNPKYFGRYAEKHEEFREAYEYAKSWQEHIVARNALKQTVNARFAQFFLGCQHDWKTKDPSEDRLMHLGNQFGKYLADQKEEDEHE